MGLAEKLSYIQQKMKVPKNMYNSFGKYNYRNAESIFEAFKQFESEYKVALIVGDEITMVGNRIYVQAIATLMDCETQESISVKAFAREASDKKGMDDSQITGTASSYARKYALNGLFLLDDTKDADTDENHNECETGQKKKEKEKGKEREEEKKRIQEKRTEIEEICKKHNYTPEAICKSNNYIWEELLDETRLTNMRYSLKQGFGEE